VKLCVTPCCGVGVGSCSALIVEDSFDVSIISIVTPSLLNFGSEPVVINGFRCSDYDIVPLTDANKQPTRVIRNDGDKVSCDDC
jgi:hypothetical protein